MARFIVYECPDCRGRFRWLHHPSDAPPPERCQCCGAWMSDDEPPIEVFEPAAPMIRKNVYAKSIDQTYREMERQSADRANEAASILEDSYNAQPHDEEFSGLLKATQAEQVAQIKSELKITNMADPSSTREG